MSHTFTILLPYLQFLAGSGSGWVASWLFDELRDDWLTVPTWPAWAAHILDAVVYRPMGARISVFVLTALIAVGASVGVAYITGQPIPGAADAALAATLAIVLGQVRHGVKTFPTVIDVDLEGDHNANEADRQH
jgi:hypothetical protein